MTFTAKNLILNVNDDMEINVGRNISTSVGGNEKTEIRGDTEHTTNSMKEMIEKNMEVSVGEANIASADGDIVITSVGKALGE